MSPNRDRLRGEEDNSVFAWPTMLAYTIVVVFLLNLIGMVVGPPVNTGGEGAAKTDNDPLSLVNLEYGAYIQQVAAELEKDEEFKKKLQEANATDLESGAISKYLEYASRQTRDKLDELKRIEVRRLQDLHMKLVKEKTQDKKLIDASHVDHSNIKTFEIEDLRRLIKKTTEDLTKLDEKRREEFKHYEMQKEHQLNEEMRQANETARLQIQKEHEESEKRHANHTKIHHPGSKDQLKEVWEDVDQMDSEFNPKAFFMMHDLNGDGYLSIEEMEALFQKELDKVYDPNNVDDDQVERDEEMSRMREHVMTEIDTDKDEMVSLEEFLRSAQGKEFEEDKGWQTLEEQPEPYTDEELKEYERALQEQEANYRKQHAAERDSLERS